MSLRRLPVLVAVLGLVAACGGAAVSKVLDAKGTGRQISDNLASRFGVAVSPATCPSGVKVAAGSTFDCHTVIDGQPLTVHVTLTDDQGHFTPTPAAAVVIVAKIADAIQGSVAKATVRCGPHAVLVEPPESTFDCTAAAATGPATYRVTVKDLAGNVSYQPVSTQAG